MSYYNPYNVYSVPQGDQSVVAQGPITPGGVALFLDSNTITSGSAPGGGDVVGPGSSTIGDVVIFNNTSGTLIADSTIPSSTLPQVSGSHTSGHIAVWGSGNLLLDGGLPSSGSVTSVTATSPILSSGGTTPNISLSSSGVTSGSYTSPNITVTSQGLITSATSTLPVYSVSGTSGDISSTGGQNPILDLVNTSVTPGTFTNPILSCDSKGRITSISSGVAITEVFGLYSLVPSSHSQILTVSTINTAVQVPITVTLDSTGSYLSSNTITPSVAGTYLLSANLYLTSTQTNGTLCTLYIYKNGSPILSSTSEINGNSTNISIPSFSISLASTDTLQVWFTSNAVGAFNFYNNPLNTFNSSNGSYFLFISPSGASGSGTVTTINSPNSTITITNGSGPVVSVDLSGVGTSGTYTYPTSITTNTYGQISSITSGIQPVTETGSVTTNHIVSFSSSNVIQDSGILSSSIATNETSTGNTITITNPGTNTVNFEVKDQSSITPGTFSLPTVTVNQQGVITSISSGIAGTVTSISEVSGQTICTPNPITSTGTIGLATSGVTSGSYTNTNLTIDSYGRITAASNGSGGSGNTTSTSLVSGNLPVANGANSIIDSGIVASQVLNNGGSTITNGHYVTGSASANTLTQGLLAVSGYTTSTNVNVTGFGAVPTPSIDLGNSGVSAGSYTNTDITVDAQGRITSASNGTSGGGTSIIGSYLISNQTISTNTQMNLSVDYDPNSLLSSNTINISTSGVYELNLTQTGYSTNNVQAQFVLYKNGSSYKAFNATQNETGTNIYSGTSGSLIANCNSGDTITLYAYVNAANYSTANAPFIPQAYLTIKLLGSVPITSGIYGSYTLSGITNTTTGNQISIAQVTSSGSYLSGNIITIPSTGLYNLAFSINGQAGSGGYVTMILWKNGTSGTNLYQVTIYANSGNQGDNLYLTSTPYNLNVGDTLQIYGYTNTSPGFTLTNGGAPSGSQTCTFSLVQVNPSSGGGGGGNTTSTSLVSGNLVKASGTNTIIDSGLTTNLIPVSTGTFTSGDLVKFNNTASTGPVIQDSGLVSGVVPQTNGTFTTGHLAIFNNTGTSGPILVDGGAPGGFSPVYGLYGVSASSGVSAGQFQTLLNGSSVNTGGYLSGNYVIIPTTGVYRLTLNICMNVTAISSPSTQPCQLWVYQNGNSGALALQTFFVPCAGGTAGTGLGIASASNIMTLTAGNQLCVFIYCAGTCNFFMPDGETDSSTENGAIFEIQRIG